MGSEEREPSSFSLSLSPEPLFSSAPGGKVSCIRRPPFSLATYTRTLSAMESVNEAKAVWPGVTDLYVVQELLDQNK